MLDTQIRQKRAVFTLAELTSFRPLTVCVFSSHLPGKEQELCCLRPVSLHSAAFSSLALMMHFHEELLYSLLLRCIAAVMYSILSECGVFFRCNSCFLFCSKIYFLKIYSGQG